MKNMMLATAALMISFAGTAMADGDPEKGESDFKKCRACHTIANGNEVIFKGGRTGPNLYGVVGRTAGTAEGFRYSSSLVDAGQAGLVWTEELLVDFVADPRTFLKEATGDSGARTKMTFKLKNAENVVAYLASIAPPAQ
ncbi:MAG: cytochrome C [Marinosulfonomonas sp.]|nr:cytochrome C [Marinosulfonomonas sp.]